MKKGRIEDKVLPKQVTARYSAGKNEFHRSVDFLKHFSNDSFKVNNNNSKFT